MSLLNIHIGQINYIILCDRVYVFVKQLCYQYSTSTFRSIVKVKLNVYIYALEKTPQNNLFLYPDLQLITQKK